MRRRVRVKAAREALGRVGRFMDANGAYNRRQALWFAEAFGGLGVMWFISPESGLAALPSAGRSASCKSVREKRSDQNLC
jgi:hypothetical protein